MVTGNARDAGAADPLAELRDRVLAAGSQPGWHPEGVAGFAEALTGTPWGACGAEELNEVLNEYDALASAVEAKRRRKRSVAQPAIKHRRRPGRRGTWAS